jgi:hypothetical protein
MNSLSYISIDSLSLDSIIELWGLVEGVFMFNFYGVICASIVISFSFTFLPMWRTYCK